jgi:archaellum biogenesis protein FlaJ (TadC family)
MKYLGSNIMTEFNDYCNMASVSFAKTMSQSRRGQGSILLSEMQYVRKGNFGSVQNDRVNRLNTSMNLEREMINRATP